MFKGPPPLFRKEIYINISKHIVVFMSEISIIPSIACTHSFPHVCCDIVKKVPSVMLLLYEWTFCLSTSNVCRLFLYEFPFKKTRSFHKKCYHQRIPSTFALFSFPSRTVCPLVKPSLTFAIFTIQLYNFTIQPVLAAAVRSDDHSCILYLFAYESSCIAFICKHQEMFEIRVTFLCHRTVVCWWLEIDRKYEAVTVCGVVVPLMG